jgi:hypothetical protein
MPRPNRRDGQNVFTMSKNESNQRSAVSYQQAALILSLSKDQHSADG